MSKPMPLSDRIIFMLRARRRTARTLARMTGKGISAVHKILDGLEEQGIIQKHETGKPVVWELADGIEVDYRPMGSDTGQLVLELDGEDPRATGGEPNRCKAVTTKGDRCENTAKAGHDVCGVHAG
jgi:hypothetical protein